jgi:hypothetical protein
MKQMAKKTGGWVIVMFMALAGLFLTTGCSDDDPEAVQPTVSDSEAMVVGLQDSYLIHYTGDNGVGLAHIGYWTLAADSEEYLALDPQEQAKVGKIQPNQLHGSLFQPTQIVAGWEATGVLTDSDRSQTVSLRIPDNWNGNLVVVGTAAFRNEYSNEATLAPWLLDAGFAFVTGDKGITGGSMAVMLNAQHPSQHWGMMMLDMARWAKARIAEATGTAVSRTYAAGLSNGGYQTRRALELDHESVAAGNERLFDGGLDWSGTYFADSRVLDTDNDGTVSVAEYAEANTLTGYSDVATLTMGWAYSEDTLTTPEQFAADPPYGDAAAAMTAAGFSVESAIFWGYYNTNYDAYKASLPAWKGVGYFNLLSYIYRAELLGHDAVAAEAYSCFSDPENPDAEPPLYDWLATVENGGWTEEGVQYALANANTGEFSVPMITVVGEADGLLALDANSIAYRAAVEQYGTPDLHRLYVIENAGHVDANVDGAGDFDFDGVPGNEGVADRLTPMQAYVQRGFSYLLDWVENGVSPPANTTIATDPANDVADSDQISF